MAETEALKKMVLSFRVAELQMLLGFAGRNKSGRKTELQARAVELLRLRSTPITLKIKELYKSIQQQNQANVLPTQQGSSAAAGSVQNSTAQQQVASTVYPNYQNPGSDRQVQQNRNSYPNNMYPYQPKASPPINSSSVFPVHPDVKLKRLPFYDLLGELLKPSSLLPQGSQKLQEANFMFHLTPQQATDIASSRDLRPGAKMESVQVLEYAIQVQMRFCLLETSCEQDDFFPPGICVKVNGKMCPLPNPIPTNKPGVEPKRPPRPVNITTLVKLSPTVANHITVSWNAEYGRGYCISCYLVHKLTSAELLQRLKSRGVKNSDFTRGLIKEKLQEEADCEIATTSLRVSLACPLGKMRMLTPCRASTCYHLQCFDASLYLQMNERKPTWMCPVCDKPALYDNLVIDGYFHQVLLSGKLSDGNEIQLHQDGSWSSLVVKKEQTNLLTPVKEKNEEKKGEDNSVVKVETLSDDIEMIEAKPCNTTKTSSNSGNKEEPKKKETVFVDLTLSDSESEDEVKKEPKSSNELRKRDTNVSGSSSKAGAVSSSGYVSPSIITLDSPSPPAPSSPEPPADPVPEPIPERESNPTDFSLPLLPPFPNSMYMGVPTAPPPYLDLESDTSALCPVSGGNPLFPNPPQY